MTVLALPVSIAPNARDVVRTVLQHGLRSSVRSRGVVLFLLGTLFIVEAVFRLAGAPDRAVVSLLQPVLLVVPLMSAVFGVMSWHGAREFNELLLAQPIDRRTLFAGLYLGQVLPLAIAFLAGLLFPFVLHRALVSDVLPLLLALAASGVALTFVFSGIAVLIAVHVDDRLRAVGMTLATWLLLTIGYDGFVLLVATTFADYPLERVMLGLTLFNPIDAARVLVVLQSDSAALMGYTGAVMARFLGTTTGSLAAGAGMICWMLLPAWFARRAFQRRDF